MSRAGTYQSVTTGDETYRIFYPIFCGWQSNLSGGAASNAETLISSLDARFGIGPAVADGNESF